MLLILRAETVRLLDSLRLSIHDLGHVVANVPRSKCLIYISLLKPAHRTLPNSERSYDAMIMRCKECLVTYVAENTARKRKQAGVCSGLQNRGAAPLVSSVRSTRTRFRQFVFNKLQD